MRTLSSQELDEIFAGQQQVSATMPNVTVTAPQYSSPGYSFPYAGSSWAGPTYNEGCGSCASYTSSGSYYALPWSQAPDMTKLRCEVNAAADPGMTIPSSANLGWYRSGAMHVEWWPGPCSHARYAAAARCRTVASVRSAPGLGTAAEPLAVEQLVAQLAVEAFDEAVLPWAARSN